MNGQKRDTSTHDPLLPSGGDEQPTDAGAYIGHEPELARDTIPGGVQPGDVRVAGVATQPTGTGPQAHTRIGSGEDAAAGGDPADAADSDG